MTTVIELTTERLQEIMESLPHEIRGPIQALLLKAFAITPIRNIQHFIDAYENDNPLDGLIAGILTSVITHVGDGVREDMKKYLQTSEKSYTGVQATLYAANTLREIANQMECHVEHNECSKCCDTKH